MCHVCSTFPVEPSLPPVPTLQFGLEMAALHHLETSLFDHRSGLTPGQLVELEREQAIVRYQSNLRGNIAGMVVAPGLDDDDMEMNLPEIIGSETRSPVEDHDGRFAKSVRRVGERLYFGGATNRKKCATHS